MNMGFSRLLLGLLFLFVPFMAEAGVVVGNQDGRVTLVEFVDYQSPSCKMMLPVIDKLITSNPGLRVVYVNMPLLGANSVYAAKAIVAANMQHKFTAFHQALLATHDGLTQDEILLIAEQVGINIKQLQADMNSPATAQLLNKDIGLGTALGVQNTPTFMVGATEADREPKQFSGAVAYQTLQQAIIQEQSPVN